MQKERDYPFLCIKKLWARENYAFEWGWVMCKDGLIDLEAST